ncbi:MAG: hypothetical protein IKT50_04690 [Clostridia bacterium]|nr:hypothetical protein [Clostridia bacterium]
MAEEIFDRESRGKLGELYSGEVKSRVEAEIILPDYKEEAHRIFRADVKPKVNQKNIYMQGNQLICEIEGVASFYILYQSERRGENGVPTSFSSQEMFSSVFKIPLDEMVDAEEVCTVVEYQVENLSFRLLGPRKLSLRFDVKTYLSVKRNELFYYYSPECSENIHTKTKEICVCRITSSHQEEKNFSETISLPSSYLAIGEICEMGAVLQATRAKTENGVVSFQGVCEITVSYLTQGEESFISFSQPIEWEERLAVSGAEEGNFCRVYLTPQFLKATTDVNESGENKNIFFELGYSVQIETFANDIVTAVEDAFSSKRELILKNDTVALDEIRKMCDFSASQKEKIPFAEKGIHRAEAILSSVDFRDSYLEDGKIKADGRLFLRFLGMMENGEMKHFDESYDFKCYLNCEDPTPLAENENYRIELCGGVKSVDIVPEDEFLSVRFELYGSLTVFCQKKESLVLEISQGEAYTSEERGILFCYPEKGESLWEFCKAHKTSPQELCAENGIDGDRLPEVVKIIR